MAEFWIIAALLTLIAVCFVLLPLWKSRASEDVDAIRQAANITLFKDQLSELDRAKQEGEIEESQYQELVTETERALLADAGDAKSAGAFAIGGKPLIVIFALLLPISAVALYSAKGQIADWEIAELVKERDQQAYYATTKNQPLDPKITTRLVKKLVNRLKADPSNIQNWFTLAQYYMELESYDNASKAYFEIVKQEPENSEVLGYYTQALYMKAGRKITPEVQAAIDKTFAINPHNYSVLGIVGISAYTSGDYQQAINAWQKILAVIPPNSQNALLIKRSIERAQAELGNNPAASPTTQKASAADAVKVAVEVALAPGLNADTGKIVFVYARSEGSRMPIAISKISVKDLPAKVVLDDSSSVMSGAKLSELQQVQLVARVSQQGTPMPKSGDLQGVSRVLELSKIDGPVKLLIDSVIP